MADAQHIQPMDCVHPIEMVERMIVLRSADDGQLMVGEAVALRLHMLKNKLINNPDEKPTISISGTKFATLATVIDYCTYLAGLSTFKKFRAQCNMQTDLVNLFNLIQSAHHLENKSLMDLTCHILKYKMRCKTIEIGKELKNPDVCVQQIPVARRLKRDLGEDKCILRNPRRQAFIMVRDCEDVPYHWFVAKELGCINRKNPYIDGYIQTILMSSKPEELADAAQHLGQLMTGDRSLAESLEPNVVQRLLDISRSDNNINVKHMAMAVLCQASFDKCRNLMAYEVIPFLVNSLLESVTEALRALIQLACAFPHCIEVIIKNQALEAVRTIVDSDRSVHEYISYSAKLLTVICRNYNLPAIKAREALEISEAILQNPKHSYRVKVRACYILSYLSHKNQVQIKQEISDMLIDFIRCGNPMLAGSALGVLGNIVRWGPCSQVEDFVKDTKLLRCLPKIILCCGPKFQKHACQIIANIAARGLISIEDMIDFKLVKPLCSLLKHEESDVQMEAAWALFNGINECTHGQIDEYPESGKCYESI